MGELTKHQRTGAKQYNQARRDQVKPATEEEKKRPVVVHPLPTWPTSEDLKNRKVFKDGNRLIDEQHPEWDAEYFRELCLYEPKHFGLPHDIKPFCDKWLTRGAHVPLIAILEYLLKRDLRQFRDEKPPILPQQLQSAIEVEIDHVAHAVEVGAIKRKAGIDPDDLEEIWQGFNYSLDNWAIRDARRLPNGYILYPAPGLPIGCPMPTLTIPGAKVLYYVIMHIQGTTDRIVVAAIDNQGALLFKAKRAEIRDYLVKTRKYVVKGARAALPFSYAKVAI